MNEIIVLRGHALTELTRWFNKKVIEPIVKEGRAAGMTDEEINLEINRVLFDGLKGLHGFPEDQRP